MSNLATMQRGGELAPRNNPIATMMSKLAENPTPENVEAICRLSNQFVEMERIEAKRSFEADFAEMQASLPAIVSDKKGPWGGEYADKESIMRQIRPTLQRFGFSIRFEHPPATDAAHLATVCVISHSGGHTIRSEPMNTRAGRPNKMMTEIQVDAGGYYAGERYALCAMLNIRAGEQDDDARVLGMLLSLDELAEMKRRAHEVGANEKSLFAMAGVQNWEEIRTGALTILRNFMTEKERRNKSLGKASSHPSSPGEPPESEKQEILRQEREAQ